jgi:hypothetical protein
MTIPKGNQQPEGKERPRERRVRGVMIERLLTMPMRVNMRRIRLSFHVIWHKPLV